MSFGPFRLDPDSGRLTRDGDPVELGFRAGEILRVLLEHAPQLVSKSTLMERVWPGAFVEDTALRFHVSALRRALGVDATGQSYVSTASGRGYRLMAFSESEQPQTRSPSNEVAVSRQHATNLHPALSQIIGRERDLDELAALAKESRLVTLVGPGGVGKTRLAAEFGRRNLNLFPGGTWLVDLAPLNAASAVAPAVAAALNLELSRVEDVEGHIALALKRARTLLIFDNCEHLTSAVSGLVRRLLQRAPTISILATSQRPLEVASEQIFILDPLETAPDDGCLDISEFAAVRFFVQRAQNADRQFALDETNSAAVAEICRRLDGIPLSLEMAARRVRILGVEGLRRALADRLQVLGGSHGHARHASLMDMLEWSYSLLSPFEQRVFRSLAAFPASFTLDAAVAVGTCEEAEHWLVVDALSVMVNLSLLSLTQRDPTRFRLLESLRLYALDKLMEAGEADDACARHASHFTDVFVEAARAADHATSPEWVRPYQPDLYNLRTSLDWALAAPDRSERAAALAAFGLRFLQGLWLIPEAHAYATRAVSCLAPETPPRIAARVLFQCAYFFLAQHDPRGVALASRAEELYRHIDDRAGLARVLLTIAAFRCNIGQYDLAEAALTEAGEILPDPASPYLKNSYIFELAHHQLCTGNYQNAKNLFKELLSLNITSSHHSRKSITGNIGLCSYMMGDFVSAITEAKAALDIVLLLADGSAGGLQMSNLGAYNIALGDFSQARKWLTQALDVLIGQTPWSVTECLRLWAVLFAEEGCSADAGSLFGFVEAERLRLGRSLTPFNMGLYNRLITRLDTDAEPAERAKWAAAGAAWSLDEAITFVTLRYETGGGIR